MHPSYWSQATSELCAADPIMARLIATYEGEMLEGRGDAFYTLARSIVGQQVSVKAADSMWGKVEAVLKNVTPARTLEMGEEALRACGLSRQKIAYLYEIARFFIENNADEAWFASRPDDEVLKALVSIKGVGRWTAEMFMLFHMLRPNVLPLDDIGLQNAVQRHYGPVTPSHDGVRMPSFDGMTKKEKYQAIESLAQKWQPWRSVATWYLWRSLDPLPVAY